MFKAAQVFSYTTFQLHKKSATQVFSYSILQQNNDRGKGQRPALYHHTLQLSQCCTTAAVTMLSQCCTTILCSCHSTGTLLHRGKTIAEAAQEFSYTSFQLHKYSATQVCSYASFQLSKFSPTQEFSNESCQLQMTWAKTQL